MLTVVFYMLCTKQTSMNNALNKHRELSAENIYFMYISQTKFVVLNNNYYWILIKKKI